MVSIRDPGYTKWSWLWALKLSLNDVYNYFMLILSCPRGPSSFHTQNRAAEQEYILAIDLHKMFLNQPESEQVPED